MSDEISNNKERDISEIFKGSYKYYFEERMYSEENFKVFKDFDTQHIIFMSEILTRVANGEFLKVNTSYTVNHKYEAVQVVIEKYLGDQFTKETFTPDKNMPQLEYIFENNTDTKEIKVQTPNKYHIATPATCCSMMFVRQKKYDPTILNSFYVITSENIWEYQKAIETKNIYYHCDNIHVQEETQISKKALTGTKFEVFTKEPDKDEGLKIIYFLSKHHAMPYQVIIDKKTRIDIKQLQDLTPSRMEDFLG